MLFPCSFRETWRFRNGRHLAALGASAVVLGLLHVVLDASGCGAWPNGPVTRTLGAVVNRPGPRRLAHTRRRHVAKWHHVHAVLDGPELVGAEQSGVYAPCTWINGYMPLGWIISASCGHPHRCRLVMFLNCAISLIFLSSFGNEVLRWRDVALIRPDPKPYQRPPTLSSTSLTRR